MADAGARRHDAEIREGLRAPAQKGVALLVTLIFDIDILLEGLGVAERVDHHAVVDHQIDFHQRIDLVRIAAQRLHGVAHRGQVDHGGHAGEILHQHAGGTEGYLAVGLAILGPGHDGLDVALGDGVAVLIAQQVFQQDPH